ncbi:hypothetical protein [Spirosoma rigui]|uniref:hypothetical protein n=1 Tax=Spirosoma rigui TaxID=564064 RepID=UPI0009AF3971|nr:hypothetical protein [Spirosoma rigui]
MENLQNELTILERLQGPTSPFFKPLVYGGAIVAGLAGGLTIFQGALTEHGLPVPGVIGHVAEIVAYVSAAIATVAKLTFDFSIKKSK